MSKKLNNLNKAIAELNAPKTYDGETFDSMFEFKIRECDDCYELYDANEAYHYDYAYESFLMARDVAREFGFEPPTEYDDDIHEKLETALKKDFGEHACLEWENSVIMIFSKEV